MPASPAGAIQSISFAFQENDQAVPIRDPSDLRFLGATPEWQAGGVSDPAAYPVGTRPTVRVVFRQAEGLSAGTWSIHAGGTGGPGIAPATVQLQFDASGVSQPVDLAMDAPLPGAIGSLQLTLDWHATAQGRDVPLGTSTHRIYLVGKMPLPASRWHRGGTTALAPRPEAVAGCWVYLPLLPWTCEWAAGLADDKAICDAIIANVHRTGFKYAVPAWGVLKMLQMNGGYCGGWYRMFQAMAGAQGVRVERRSFWPYWPPDVQDDVRWCAIVVRNPGINQTEPQEAPSTYHDVATQPVKSAPVTDVTERRYRFWGSPGVASDGHCINFLQYGGTYYVYDACFFDHAVPLQGFVLPDVQGTTPIAADTLGNFKEAYLQNAVDHMLGTIEVSGRIYRALPPQGQKGGPEDNGITVQTSIIPHDAARLDFYWMT